MLDNSGASTCGAAGGADGSGAGAGSGFDVGFCLVSRRVTLWKMFLNWFNGIFSTTVFAVAVKAEAVSPTCLSLHANRIPATKVRVNPTPMTNTMGDTGKPLPFCMGTG